MPVGASGPLSLPLENLRQLLARCPSFQAWVSAVDEAEAALRVHLVDMPPPGNGREYTQAELDGMRPLAVVNEFIPPQQDWAENYVAERSAEGDFFEQHGMLTLHFEQSVHGDYLEDDASAKLEFLNNVGAVLSDLLGLQGVDGALSIHRIRQFRPALRNPGRESVAQGDYLTVQFVVHWGI